MKNLFIVIGIFFVYFVFNFIVDLSFSIFTVTPAVFAICLFLFIVGLLLSAYYDKPLGDYIMAASVAIFLIMEFLEQIAIG